MRARVCICGPCMSTIGQHTHETVHKSHSGNHLLSQSNHILIAAEKDVATCSPTGSELQRVPVDLLDMWAICLPACGFPSFSALYTYSNMHTDCCPAHVYTLITLCYIRTPPYTLLTFKCHTLCVSVEGCYLAVWCWVSLSVGPLSSLLDKSPRQKHISHHGSSSGSSSYFV